MYEAEVGAMDSLRKLLPALIRVRMTSAVQLIRRLTYNIRWDLVYNQLGIELNMQISIYWQRIHDFSSDSLLG